MCGVFCVEVVVVVRAREREMKGMVDAGEHAHDIIHMSILKHMYTTTHTLMHTHTYPHRFKSSPHTSTNSPPPHTHLHRWASSYIICPTQNCLWAHVIQRSHLIFTCNAGGVTLDSLGNTKIY